MDKNYMKNNIKDKIKKCQITLDNISTNFKNRDDDILYNLTKDKLNIFVSMIDKIDSTYYDKLSNNLDEIINITKILLNSEQNIDTK